MEPFTFGEVTAKTNASAVLPGPEKPYFSTAGIGNGAFSNKPESSKKNQALIRFRSLTFEIDLPDSARANTKPSEDYSDIFLCHAKLYVFADRYDIAKLRRIALSKLHKVLLKFTLYSQRARDVALLLEYAYRNTASRKSKVDDLRELIVQYAAYHIEKLMPDEVFKTILQAENDFSLDLIGEILQRLD